DDYGRGVLRLNSSDGITSGARVKCWVGQETLDCLCQPWYVAGFHHDSRFAVRNYFGNSGPSSADGGKAKGHSLHQANREHLALHITRKNDQMRATHNGGNLSMIYPSPALHNIAQVQAIDFCFYLGAHWSITDKCRTKQRIARREFCYCGQQFPMSLSGK